MYNFPFLIGNTSSIRVHLPTSYVRLPECLLYPHGKVQYVFFNIHASHSLSTSKTTYILLSNLHSVDFLIDRRIYRFQNPPSSCNFGTWWEEFGHPEFPFPKISSSPFIYANTNHSHITTLITILSPIHSAFKSSHKKSFTKFRITCSPTTLSLQIRPSFISNKYFSASCEAPTRAHAWITVLKLLTVGAMFRRRMSCKWFSALTPSPPGSLEK